MTSRTLTKRSLRFHWRSHLGVVLGAAVGSAALIGALIVGDSVRESLRQAALQRLGDIHFVLDSGDRLFTTALPNRLRLAENRMPVAGIKGFSDGVLLGRTMVFGDATNHYLRAAGVLHAHGSAANTESSARANQVNIFGIDDRFAEFATTNVFAVLSADETVLNEALAFQLGVKVGDTVLLRVRKSDAISADSPIAMSDASVALRFRVRGIAGANELGNLSLRANQVPPYNAFVQLRQLQTNITAEGRANWIITGRMREQVQSFDVPWYRALANKLKLNWAWVKPTGKPRLVLTTNDLRTADTVLQLQHTVRQQIAPEDLQLRFRWLRGYSGVEVRSSRIFIESELTAIALKAVLPPSEATNAATRSRPVQILTYLVNQLRSSERMAPYSMVTATDSPLLPADLRDDEVIINQWLADDLKIGPDSELVMAFFLPDQAAQLTEHTNRFRVRAVIPMDHELSDRSLMPDFPGVAQAEHAGDWDTSFPLVHKIRPQDDDYWQKYRGTPKAFITLRMGQTMWTNGFGDLTAIRYSIPEDSDEQRALNKVRVTEREIRRAFLRALGQPAGYDPGQRISQQLDIAKFGFQFIPVREQALRAASQSQDFGGLFIGFSFFLIIAALILMALLFQFGLEQRVEEIGTLLALGFRAKRVRRLFLLEGAALAFLGGIIGVMGGIIYAKLMLRGLTTIWRDATNTSALTFHASPVTLGIGLISAVVVAVVTIWFVLRKQARQPARALLAGEWRDELRESHSSSRTAQSGTRGTRPSSLLRRLFSASVVAWVGFGLAVAIVSWALIGGDTANPGIFFGGGSLCLVASLAFTSLALSRMLRRESKKHFSHSSFSIRGAARRKNRSVATVAMLASGVFLIVAIGAFRLDADQNAWKRNSGTGGFALIGESTLPILKDLNTSEGRDALGLDQKILQGVSFVPFRVREGDDASCLNLNRAQQPRLLGVNPHLLADRNAFTFAKGTTWASLNGRARVLSSPDRSDIRSATNSTTRQESRPTTRDEVAAIGDAASIQWALGKKIGDTLTYQDERGTSFDARLVGGLANSILQGPLIIEESEFTRRFPGVSGYRMFLIDCPSNALPQVSAELSRALQDYGFEVTPAAQRLAAFNAVQNTYLNTFQVLGGLGLLLGSLGLGIVVLRNVLERRAELALLIAVGFRRARVQRLVLAEHAALLGLGLVIGVLAAVVAILPSVLSPRAELPLRSLALTLIGVLLFGLLSTWLATRAAVKGNLLEGLRNE